MYSFDSDEHHRRVVGNLTLGCFGLGDLILLLTRIALYPCNLFNVHQNGGFINHWVELQTCYARQLSSQGFFFRQRGREFAAPNIRLASLLARVLQHLRQSLLTFLAASEKYL